jgi:hypothetical protein
VPDINQVQTPESLTIRRELGDRQGIAYSLEGLAALVAAAGAPLHAPPPGCTALAGTAALGM